jgi:hypothetical protein
MHIPLSCCDDTVAQEYSRITHGFFFSKINDPPTMRLEKTGEIQAKTFDQANTNIIVQKMAFLPVVEGLKQVFGPGKRRRFRAWRTVDVAALATVFPELSSSGLKHGPFRAERA